MTELRCRYFNGQLQPHHSRPLAYHLLVLADTPVTHDAGDFMTEGYTLRPAPYNRTIEVLVGITYYNEDKALLCRTLHSAIEACRWNQNLHHPRQYSSEEGFGCDWKKTVICIILDGLDASDPGALDALAAMGLFRHGLLKRDVNGMPVKSHVVRGAASTLSLF